ncbi:MAG: DUF4412 domain-containing protein [Candidatus Schekmanbacteria bacterium]|nr:DUF4412 domain-containing protein [Candidatus Schekmanbacteria bacterium]
MLPKTPKLIAVSLLSLLLGSQLAWADTMYEQAVTTEYEVGPKKFKETANQKVYTQDKRMRIEDLESGEVTLIHFDHEMLYKVDTRKGTYSESSFRSLRIMQGQEIMQSQQGVPQRTVGREAAKEQLKKMTEGLPPERRTFMEQMMMQQQKAMGIAPPDEEKKPEQPPESAYQIKDTEQTTVLNGLLCRKVKVLAGDKKVIDMWVTTKVGPDNYFTQIVEALGLFKPEVLTLVKKVEGFPLEQTYRIQVGSLAGHLQSVTVKKIEQTAADKNLFELPNGYIKQEAAEQEKGKAQEKESF